MTDITPIFTAVITLITAFVAAYLIPYLRQRTDEEDLILLSTLTKMAVATAEQRFTSDEGTTKKEYVLNFLNRYNLNVDEMQIEVAIEAAVLSLHRQLEGAT